MTVGQTIWENMEYDSAMTRDLPEPFNFYRQIFHDDHLHFGYWPEDLSGFTLEEAQARLSGTLKKYFPPAPADVLDIGCGFGATTGRLAREGYHVTAMSPSESMIAYAKIRHGHPLADFVPSGFLDRDAPFLSKKYDVLLFQESLQYLSPLDSVFQRAGELLKPGGVVIVCDEIMYDNDIKGETAVHGKLEVDNALAENGFSVTANKQIGKQVKKTCETIIGRFTEKFHEIVRETGQPDAAERLKVYVDGWKSQEKWYENGQFGYEIIIARPTSVSIQPYRTGDESKILGLFNRVFSPVRTADHWYWKFRDTPFGDAHAALAFGPNRELAANFCGYPVPIYDKNGTPTHFLSQQLGDTMTDPEFRNVGFGKTNILTRTATYYYDNYCQGSVPFSFGFNTGKIRKFGERFLRFGYLPKVPYHVSDISHTDVPNSFLSKIINRVFRGFSVEKVTAVSPEYDVFFEKVRDDYVMLSVRDAKYLKWRYLDCPDKRHHVFCLRRFGKLIGWSVFSRKNESLIWGDALFDKRHADSVSFLLNTVRQTDFSDMKSIAGWFSPEPRWWSEILKNIGFEITREPDDIAPAIIFFGSAYSLEYLGHNLYYTKGDSDLF